MNPGTKRSILRWIHIIFGIPIIGYVYSPFKDLPDYAPVIRYVALPVIALSGLWMWKRDARATYFEKICLNAPTIHPPEHLERNLYERC